MSRKYLALLAASLALPQAGAAEAASAPAKPYDFTGGWKTSQGATAFRQQGDQVTATYPLRNGRVVGKVTGTVAEGYWVQSLSERRCAEAREGSAYWGHVRLAANPKARRFAGRWSYCDDPIRPDGGGAWTGRRR